MAEKMSAEEAKILDNVRSAVASASIEGVDRVNEPAFYRALQDPRNRWIRVYFGNDQHESENVSNSIVGDMNLIWTTDGTGEDRDTLQVSIVVATEDGIEVSRDGVEECISRKSRYASNIVRYAQKLGGIAEDLEMTLVDETRQKPQRKYSMITGWAFRKVALTTS